MGIFQLCFFLIKMQLNPQQLFFVFLNECCIAASVALSWLSFLHFAQTK